MLMIIPITGNEQKLSRCDFNSEISGYNYCTALQFTANCCMRDEPAKQRTQ